MDSVEEFTQWQIQTFLIEVEDDHDNSGVAFSKYVYDDKPLQRGIIFFKPWRLKGLVKLKKSNNPRKTRIGLTSPTHP